MIEVEKSKKDSPEITPERWREAIVRGITTGTPVQLLEEYDFDPKRPGGDPQGSRTMPELQASLLREILVEFTGDHDPRGLILVGARISGDLDLAGTATDISVRFLNVRMNGELNLQGFRCPMIAMRGSAFSRVVLAHAVVENLVSINDCVVDLDVDLSCMSCGELRMQRVAIRNRGNVSAETENDATVGITKSVNEAPNPSNYAIDAQCMDVKGMAAFSGLFVRGEIHLVGAVIGGYLSLKGTKVVQDCQSESSPGAPDATHPCLGMAICMDSAEIGGVLNLGGLQSTCHVNIRGAKIGGQIRLEKTKIGRPRGRTIRLDRCGLDLTGTYIGSSGIMHGLTSGRIELRDATMKDLDLTKANVDRREGISFEAIGASFASVDLGGSRFTGAVRLRNSTVAGSVQAGLSRRVTSLSEFDISNASVAGRVDLQGVHIKGGGINAEYAQVGGSFIIQINSEVEAGAQVNFAYSSLRKLHLTSSTKITGDVSVERASITDVVIGGVSTKEMLHIDKRLLVDVLNISTFRATNCNVSHLQLCKNTTAKGGLELDGASVGHLDLQGKAQDVPHLKWTTRSVRIAGVSGLPFNDSVTCSRWLDGGVTTRVQSDHDVNFQPRVRNASSDAKDFQAQPWLEMAKVFESGGRESDGRRLRYQAADRLLKNSEHWTTNTAWRLTSKWTIGHGFYSQAALAWLAAIWIVSTLLISFNAEAFTPTDRSAAILTNELLTVTAPDSLTSEEDLTGVGDMHPHTSRMEEPAVATAATTPAPLAYPSLIAPLYAVDIVLSPLGTGQSAAWQVSSEVWLSTTLAVLKMMSWALLGMFITGVSGLIGRK